MSSSSSADHVVKMENQEFVIPLGHNACIRASVRGVEMTKSTYNGIKKVFLNASEWFTLVGKIDEMRVAVKKLSNDILHRVMNKEERDKPLETYERILSDNIGVSISAFKPQAIHLINIHIRGYHYDEVGKMIFMKTPGVALNPDEFQGFKDQATGISDFLCSIASEHRLPGLTGRTSECHCELCIAVAKFMVLDDTESGTVVGTREEFNYDCLNPMSFIPAYRKIHQFVMNGTNQSVLVIRLTKKYNGENFSAVDEENNPGFDQTMRSSVELLIPSEDSQHNSSSTPSFTPVVKNFMKSITGVDNDSNDDVPLLVSPTQSFTHKRVTRLSFDADAYFRHDEMIGSSREALKSGFPLHNDVDVDADYLANKPTTIVGGAEEPAAAAAAAGAETAAAAGAAAKAAETRAKKTPISLPKEGDEKEEGGRINQIIKDWEERVMEKSKRRKEQQEQQLNDWKREMKRPYVPTIQPINANDPIINASSLKRNQAVVKQEEKKEEEEEKENQDLDKTVDYSTRSSASINTTGAYDYTDAINTYQQELKQRRKKLRFDDDDDDNQLLIADNVVVVDDATPLSPPRRTSTPYPHLMTSID